MARLTIEHDAAREETGGQARRRSIALRLDGRAWLRVEPEAFLELGVADGDEIDDERKAAVEAALGTRPGTALRRAVARGADAVRRRDREEARRARCAAGDRAGGDRAGHGLRLHRRRRSGGAARTGDAGAGLRPTARRAEAALARPVGVALRRRRWTRRTAAATRRSSHARRSAAEPSRTMPIGAAPLRSSPAGGSRPAQPGRPFARQPARSSGRCRCVRFSPCRCRRATRSATVCSRARIRGARPRSRHSRSAASTSSSTSRTRRTRWTATGICCGTAAGSRTRSSTWERRPRAT